MRAQGNLNVFKFSAYSVVGRGAQLATLGALLFSAQVACSDDSGTDNTTFTSVGGSGTTNGTGFGTGGTGFGTSGTGFGTSGSDFGTSGSAGTGGAAGGTGGTGSGGTGLVVVTPYCDSQPASPLPFEVTTSFYPSQWQGDVAAISIPADLALDACTARIEGAVGECSKWRYTPNATTPAWAGVGYSTFGDANYTHPPVCLAAGASKVTFHARGAVGGEVVTVAAAGADEIAITLTAEWKPYEIPLAGIIYNTPEIGMTSGFFWKVAPPAGITAFFFDNIQVVSGGAPPVGGGGTGGGGGVGGTQ